MEVRRQELKDGYWLGLGSVRVGYSADVDDREDLRRTINCWMHATYTREKGPWCSST